MSLQGGHFKGCADSLASFRKPCGISCCFAWTHHHKPLNTVGKGRLGKMNSFSINAILGTDTYDDSETFGSQNMKSECCPGQQAKTRKLIDTDDDEGVLISLCFV